jgi:hypothetical protein
MCKRGIKHEALKRVERQFTRVNPPSIESAELRVRPRRRETASDVVWVPNLPSETHGLFPKSQALDGHLRMSV